MMDKKYEKYAQLYGTFHTNVCTGVFDKAAAFARLTEDVLGTEFALDFSQPDDIQGVCIDPSKNYRVLYLQGEDHVMRAIYDGFSPLFVEFYERVWIYQMKEAAKSASRQYAQFMWDMDMQRLHMLRPVISQTTRIDKNGATVVVNSVPSMLRTAFGSVF